MGGLAQMRLERKIESDAVEQIEGWWGSVYCLKLNVLGRRGWPDRLILAPEGTVMFVEFKRVGEKPRKLQEFCHDILTTLGFEVQVHDDTDEAVEAVKAYIRSKTDSAPFG
jgi:hypothetical protein